MQMFTYPDLKWCAATAKESRFVVSWAVIRSSETAHQSAAQLPPSMFSSALLWMCTMPGRRKMSDLTLLWRWQSGVKHIFTARLWHFLTGMFLFCVQSFWLFWSEIRLNTSASNGYVDCNKPIWKYLRLSGRSHRPIHWSPITLLWLSTAARPAVLSGHISIHSIGVTVINMLRNVLSSLYSRGLQPVLACRSVWCQTVFSPVGLFQAEVGVQFSRFPLHF